MKGRNQVARMEEVLRALPLAKGKEADVGMWAQQLAMGSLFLVNDLPRANLTTPAKARAEIRRLGKLAHQLASHILTMHANSLDVIRKQKPRKDPLMIFDDLKSIVDLEEKARALVSSVPSLTTAKGRPKKRNAGEVARIAGDAYRSLTRKEPTVSTKDGVAYGPFLEFLDQILNVLDVDAKPEHLARTIARKVRNRKK